MSYIYILYHNYHQVLSDDSKLVKIGSTMNIINRMMCYKTYNPEFNNKHNKLHVITIRQSLLNCYEIDELLKYITNKYSYPFPHYNSLDGGGGTEWYNMGNVEQLTDLFDKINILYDIEKMDIDKLLRKSVKPNFNEIQDDIDNKLKINMENIMKVVEQIENEVLRDIITLRPWQQKCMDVYNEFMDSIGQCGIITAPTGCGKSFILCLCAVYFCDKTNNNVIIVTKRKEIFNGFVSKIKDIMNKLLCSNKITNPVKVIDLVDSKYNYKVFRKKKRTIFIINFDKFVSSNRFRKYTKYSFGRVKIKITHISNTIYINILVYIYII